MTQRLRIAIDAMGGDNAPAVPVEGAVLAAQEKDTEIILVGDEDSVGSELLKHDASNLPISIVAAQGKIEDGEAPALALRQKPNASITVAFPTAIAIRQPVILKVFESELNSIATSFAPSISKIDGAI